MNILLTKHHDITPFCHCDTSRYVLMGVHYNKEAKRLEATDGRIWIQVPVEESEEGPPVHSGGEPPKDCVIPAIALSEAIANIPHKAGFLGLRQAVLVSTDADHCIIASTDLDTERVTHSKLIEGDYPKMEQIWPKDPPKFTIHLNKLYLKMLWDYACQHDLGCDAIKCEFWNDLMPMRFTIKLKDEKEAIGLLMPTKP